MGKQICFYEKNFLDFDNEAASITATEGTDFARFVRSRSLREAFVTTDSVDANNTAIEFDLGSVFNFDRLLLLDHNLKSYKLEQYDSETGLWTELYSTTNDTQGSSEIVLEEGFGQTFKLTIYGTQVPDSDKRINRMVITKKLGQFSYWPKIESTLDKGKTARVAVSGKKSILKTVGAFSCRLSIDNWRNAADLELIERLYRQVQGFEMWLSGGDEDQFFYAVESYRKEDLYLMGLANDLRPNLPDGVYRNGYNLTLDLVEVVR